LVSGQWSRGPVVLSSHSHVPPSPPTPAVSSARPGLDPTFLARIREITLRLFEYCRAENWAGYDPYDALNSRLFRALPFLDWRLPRLVATQALKRCPINIRPLLLIPKTQNPKALALFLQSSLKLDRLDLLPSRNTITELVDSIVKLRSPDLDYWCWGYSFPWQTRSLLVPRGAPNLVCTTFVANALLDAFEAGGDASLLDKAASAAAYIVERLYWTDAGGVASLSYPVPGVRSQVHNANLLGAALLARVARLTGRRDYMHHVLALTRYAVSRQQPDGSWFYGEHPKQRWIDNFHTGYNLCALRVIGRETGSDEFEEAAKRGYRFYRQHFFCEDGAPKYFHNQPFPIDCHCAAQSVLTLLDFQDLDATAHSQAERTLHWTIQHLLDPQGFFHYQRHQRFTNRSSFIRWTQAWMLLGLVGLVEDDSNLSPLRSESDSPSARAF